MSLESATGAYRFTVEGAASPDLPLRILNLFAQQDLAYDRVAIARDADRYAISVDHHDLPAERADVILEKMRAMVLVDRAGLEISPPT